MAFKTAGEGAAEEGLSGGSQQDQTGTEGRKPVDFNPRNYRLFRRPKLDLDKLEILLSNAEMYSSNTAKMHILEQFVRLLENSPGLANRVPKDLLGKALDLALQLNHLGNASKLFHQFGARTALSLHNKNQLSEIAPSHYPRLEKMTAPGLRHSMSEQN